MASIDRIDNDKEIYYMIHRNGKKCELHTTKNIKILLNICHKNNEYFGEKKTKITKLGKINTIENADKIIKEFDSYFKSNTKNKKKLIVIPDNINKIVDKIKIVKKLPTRGKVVISAGLAATIGITGFGINRISKEATRENVYTPIVTIEEVPEYIDDLPDIEMSSPNENIYDNMDDVIINYDPDFIIEDDKVIEDTKVETNDIELDQMLNIDEFHFSYNDRTDSDSLSNAKRYEDLFIKYGNRYGVDPTLLMAIAAQESSGDHYGNLTGGCAMGIMQIEKKIFIGSTISAYNFETGEMDKMSITYETLEDLESNIKAGTMIWRNRIEENKYNIPIGTQGYNYGPGNMNKVFNSFTNDTGISKSELREDYSNSDWLNYRNAVSVGDPIYVEHVFSYIKSGTVLTTKTRDGDIIELKIVNDKVNEKQMV